MAKKQVGTSSPGRNRGDVLARGGASMNFGSMSFVTQSKWDSIFGENPKLSTKKTKKKK